jgi:hypothetical protein
MKGNEMQIPVTPKPGQTPEPKEKPEPNIVNREDYKMHVLKREYAVGEFEILIERWIPETGWTRTQILVDSHEVERLRLALGF